MQGIDYTYTLQGWLKGVNHPQGTISSVGSFRGLDPGGDSLDAHPNYAPDAFGMALRYHRGDFYRDAAPFHSDEASTPAGAEVLNLPAWDPGAGPRDLYNGNISSWTSNTVAGPSGGGNPVLIDQTLTGFTYEYDVLNRIRRSRYHKWNGSTLASQGNPYYSGYSYDPNGNLTGLARYEAVTWMDRFRYEYTPGTNRLDMVMDSATSSSVPGDLEPGQWSGNYTYDASGNLVGDEQEGIDPTAGGGIEWRADGKVWRVTKSSGTPEELKFSYNASGDRVIKKVSDNGVERRLFYVREAGGKVLAIYEQVCTPPYTGPEDPELDSDGDEIPDKTDNCPCLPNQGQIDEDLDGIGDLCDPVIDHMNPSPTPDSDGDGNDDEHDNCLCVDNPSTNGLPNGPQTDSDGNGVGDACDRGCEIVLIELHVYGNGSEGRIAISRPSGITRSGLRGDTSAIDVAVQPLPPLPPVPPVWVRDSILTRVLDEKVYELKDHLGNVRVVISDVKEPTTQSGEAPFGVTLRRYTNYYPFGMTQPGRSYAATAGGEYRYGFNGKESDDEVGERGGWYDYGFRVYNSKLGKFLSIDPLSPNYPQWSPYVFGMNRVIDGVDLDGLEWSGTVTRTSDGWEVYRLSVKVTAFNSDVDDERFNNMIAGVEQYGPGMLSNVDKVNKRIYIVETVDVDVESEDDLVLPGEGDAFQLVTYMRSDGGAITEGKSRIGGMTSNLIGIRVGHDEENRDIIAVLHELAHSLGVRHEDATGGVYDLIQENGPHSEVEQRYILDDEIDKVYLAPSSMERVGDTAASEGVLEGSESNRFIDQEAAGNSDDGD